MCGIGGIVRVWTAGEAPPPLHESIPEAWLNIIDGSIRHRGPDGQGRFRQRALRRDGAIVDVALVHRRLSIIDHSGGGQPMLLGATVATDTPGVRGERSATVLGWPHDRPIANPAAGPLIWMARPTAPPPGGPGEYRPARAHVCPRCGPAAVVFNGCIYNHRELRRELQALGHEFHTDHSDTEVLLHGWAAWGPDLGRHLDGMYAALIWEGEAATLHGVRDAPGEKPLYHTLLEPGSGSGRTEALGSVPAGLARLSAHVGPRATRIAPGDVLRECIETGWTAGAGTALAGVREISRSAPWASAGIGQARADADPDLWPRRGSGPALSAHEVDAMVTRAVESRLDADVPLACFLSGGIDSALTAAAAQRRVGEMQAFTVRMPAPGHDESPAAAETARRLGIRHVVLDCHPDPAADLVGLIEQVGLPFGDSSLLPTMWVSRAVGSHVRVALSGDGGDELFGGYQRHTIAGTLARWGWLIRLLPARLAPSRDAGSRSARVRRLIQAARADGYPDLLRVFSQCYARHLLGPDPQRKPAGARVNDPLRHDFLSYLPGDILRKTDTASMSVGLEVRAPFLARELVAACLGAPLSSLMPGGERKGLLRQVARMHLPCNLVDRPKRGFAIPVGAWFRTDYGGMRQLLHDHLGGPDPFPGLPLEIDMACVRRLLRSHDAAGERSANPWHGRDQSQRLYLLLVLSIWTKWLARLPGPGLT
ncbi:MAG: hypothetical protein IT439_01475 [Phycisphaerales bacterium]|nr:hypothetical protein [Phycisphaerales bacterium]